MEILDLVLLLQCGRKVALALCIFELEENVVKQKIECRALEFDAVMVDSFKRKKRRSVVDAAKMLACGSLILAPIGLIHGCKGSNQDSQVAAWPWDKAPVFQGHSSKEFPLESDTQYWFDCADNNLSWGASALTLATKSLETTTGTQTKIVFVIYVGPLEWKTSIPGFRLPSFNMLVSLRPDASNSAFSYEKYTPSLDKEGGLTLTNPDVVEEDGDKVTIAYRFKGKSFNELSSFDYEESIGSSLMLPRAGTVATCKGIKLYKKSKIDYTKESAKEVMKAEVIRLGGRVNDNPK
jgi:hypothetical protein